MQMLRCIDTKLAVSSFLGVNKINVKYGLPSDSKQTAVHAPFKKESGPRKKKFQLPHH